VLFLLETDEEAKALWEKIPQHIKAAIFDPSKYIGDAVARTHSICDQVETELNRPLFIGRLDRPAERSALLLD
jgi:hypothetical protein